MIVKESIHVDAAEPGFVHVRYVQMQDEGFDMGGPLWFSRDNLPWVVETLRSCLNTYNYPRTEAQHGDDSFRVYESGPEQEPYINLHNRRPKDGPHGGVYALVMRRPMAEKLLHELAAL